MRRTPPVRGSALKALRGVKPSRANSSTEPETIPSTEPEPVEAPVIEPVPVEAPVEEKPKPKTRKRKPTTKKSETNAGDEETV